MNTRILRKEELLRLIGQGYKHTVVLSQPEEKLFQSEIRALYEKVIDGLSAYGLEGDYYGVSDFAVRPDLRDRHTTKAPPAPPFREFTITILAQKFYRTSFLKIKASRFLTPRLELPRNKIYAKAATVINCDG